MSILVVINVLAGSIVTTNTVAKGSAAHPLITLPGTIAPCAAVILTVVFPALSPSALPLPKFKFIGDFSLTITL